MNYYAELISDIETNVKRMNIEEAEDGDYAAITTLLDKFEETGDTNALDDARIWSDTDCVHPFVDESDEAAWGQCVVCEHSFFKEADGEGSWDWVSA